ncbi:MAG: bifunctional UDP-N-acetylglucosamine diphosphorylase/glucosamine-1-phosphate N-acetyltransferase GlmU [Candidatus Thiodiazotropha sp. (ex Lucinoma aequizonata)]|nr:bifunctional UDP-N-acetylglucosamine diphosphorylase/glucosamine-1-phosphate N-acetyltransferase GlmU [Candidatus Thiodiazotropha sp. (ex Lucinoma aequizonata)]MCU7888215.1 bifunctional UDP-N-acetylglucosamine diphosphorylase/glucosamine-1-phosphate N-acetyltransferase GlmU [Candidatus Thiodiazotropha sp. (ex Lucinoma aequizonata)]MCU7894542.1 bifunctional UDP-N-acetylglucosamine diphosphorylase/glucosamine-1-phosphate N-acetyltransferase GlmU [Candidatus Thiodiazotropha sp. (ex Lucinoma aequi
MPLGVLVLAAGEGTRMRSNLPKVLHRLGGKSLLGHVLDTARSINPDEITIVYGHGGDQVPTSLAAADLAWVEQRERLGTGHAVMQALPSLQKVEQVLILYGDVPLISYSTLSGLLSCLVKSDLALLTVDLFDPTGYGRIVRDGKERITRIVEQKDARLREQEITEINTGIMAVNRNRLDGWLARLDNDNAQKEYYLTDIIAMAVEDGIYIQGMHPDSEEEVMGVNDRKQLAHLERFYQRQCADELMRNGAYLADPTRIDVRGRLTIGKDVFLDCNVIVEGEVSLADGVLIGPNVLLKNCSIGEGTEVFANSVVEDAMIGRVCRIGPFARVRPESQIADYVHLGNFVEIKKSQVAEGSKINHLSYIGDSSIGKQVNIGAGTITCNYDGANKYRTIIGDRAFIGSDTQLVAPVSVGEGATIGAGSTITRDAPPEKLTLSRSKQVNIEGWQQPVKKPK